jgi:PEGA domain
MSVPRIKVFCRLLGATLFLSSLTFAQNPKPGKLKMSVSPKQAYTFVDGKAIGPGNRVIKLDVGTHHVLVANYGYKFVEQDVSMDSDKTVPVDIKLEPLGAPVPGPRGRIQIEAGRLHGATAAAVLLNGKKPLYFVGHVDEFDHDIIWHQELIVPPGTHQVTVTRDGKELWSGPITVAADQRVIVNISNGKEKTKPWARGSACPTYRPECEMPKLAPRFTAGIASATVVVFESVENRLQPKYAASLGFQRDCRSRHERHEPRSHVGREDHFASANHCVSAYRFRTRWRDNAEHDGGSQLCRAIVAERFADGS